MINQNDFRKNQSKTSQIMTIRRILETVRAKNREQHYYLKTSPRLLTSYTEERWRKYFGPTVSPNKPSQP